MTIVSCAACRSASLMLLVVSSLAGAPMLRLYNSALVVEVAPGTASTTQTMYAYNTGDGSLGIGVSVPPSVPWLTATVGGNGCTVNAPPYPCVPLQFVLNTGNLARGTY